jgi:hypothetical protein
MTEKEELIKKAVAELGINKPVMASKMIGNRLELYLYGGEVVSYTTTASKKKSAAKDTAGKKTSTRKKSTSK